MNREHYSIIMYVCTMPRTAACVVTYVTTCAHCLPASPYSSMLLNGHVSVPELTPRMLGWMTW